MKKRNSCFSCFSCFSSSDILCIKTIASGQISKVDTKGSHQRQPPKVATKVSNIRQQPKVLFSPLREKRQTKNKTNKRIKRSDLPLVFTIYFCFCFEGLNVSNDFIAFTHLPILICRQKSTDAINKSMILPILENSREFFSILEISLFSRIKKSREIQHHQLL